MNYLYVAVGGLTVLANGAAAFADLTKAAFVLKTSREVGVSPSWLPLLGFLKGAGALGLLVGLFGIPVIGTAAAAGLVVFFIGALVFHIRSSVLYNIAFPFFFLALAAMSLALSILT